MISSIFVSIMVLVMMLNRKFSRVGVIVVSNGFSVVMLVMFCVVCLMVWWIIGILWVRMLLLIMNIVVMLIIDRFFIRYGVVCRMVLLSFWVKLLLCLDR